MLGPLFLPVDKALLELLTLNVGVTRFVFILEVEDGQIRLDINGLSGRLNESVSVFGVFLLEVDKLKGTHLVTGRGLIQGMPVANSGSNLAFVAKTNSDQQQKRITNTENKSEKISYFFFDLVCRMA